VIFSNLVIFLRILVIFEEKPVAAVVIGTWQLHREIIEHRVYSEWIRCVLRCLQMISSLH